MAMNWRSPSPIKEATALALCLGAPRAASGRRAPGASAASSSLKTTSTRSGTLSRAEVLLVGEAKTPLADTRTSNATGACTYVPASALSPERHR